MSLIKNVILNEVKNLKEFKTKILRYAQDDTLRLLLIELMTLETPQGEINEQ